MVHTKFSFMSDQEFIHSIEDKKHLSPVIAELCRRLECRSEGNDSKADDRVECPVCEAELRVELDEANDLYEIYIAGG